MNEGEYDLHGDSISKVSFMDYLLDGSPIDGYTLERASIRNKELTRFSNAGDVLYQDVSLYNLTNTVVYFGSSVTGTRGELKACRRGSICGKTDGIVVLLSDITNNRMSNTYNYNDLSVPLSNLEMVGNTERLYKVVHIPSKELFDNPFINVPELGLSFSLTEDTCKFITISDLADAFTKESKRFAHQYADNGLVNIRLLWPYKLSSPAKLYTYINNTAMTIPIIKDSNISEPIIQCKFINEYGISDKREEIIAVNKLDSGINIFLGTLKLFISDKLTTIRDVVDNERQASELEAIRYQDLERKLAATERSLTIKEQEVKALKLQQDAMAAETARLEAITKSTYKIQEAQLKTDEYKYKSAETEYKQEEVTQKKKTGWAASIKEVFTALFAVTSFIGDLFKTIKFVSDILGKSKS